MTYATNHSIRHGRFKPPSLEGVWDRSGVWIGLIVSIVFLHGCEEVPFRLAQTEIVTLIGSTTLNVLGLFVIVARYLFPKR